MLYLLENVRHALRKAKKGNVENIKTHASDWVAGVTHRPALNNQIITIISEVMANFIVHLKFIVFTPVRFL